MICHFVNVLFFIRYKLFHSLFNVPVLVYSSLYSPASRIEFNRSISMIKNFTWVSFTSVAVKKRWLKQILRRVVSVKGNGRSFTKVSQSKAKERHRETTGNREQVTGWQEGVYWSDPPPAVVFPVRFMCVCAFVFVFLNLCARQRVLAPYSILLVDSCFNFHYINSFSLLFLID